MSEFRNRFFGTAPVDLDVQRRSDGHVRLVLTPMRREGISIDLSPRDVTDLIHTLRHEPGDETT